MSDRRQEILNYHIDNHPTHGLSIEQERIAIGAMDEYMKECCMALLQYMADNSITLSLASLPEDPLFSHKGTLLTKDELFENFL